MTRSAIIATRDRYDATALTAAWQAALAAPERQGPPVWFHGDLHPANLLVDDGQLCVVIDFGLAGIGDPACDLMIAWTYLSTEAREIFRTAVSAGDASWGRGRGWALAVGLMMSARSQDDPILATIGHHTVTEVLADHEADDSYHPR